MGGFMCSQTVYILNCKQGENNFALAAAVLSFYYILKSCAMISVM